MPGIGLNTGLRALMTSRYMLDTVGHNIANANVDGYSRQSVDLAAGTPRLARGLLIGTGVDARSVRRTVDALLQRRILGQTSMRGRLESRYTGLTEIESLLREPEGASISSRLDGFFGSISSLSTDPTDSVLRAGLLNSGDQLTSRFNELAKNLDVIRQDSDREVAIHVEEVNELAREVSALNQEISALESAGLQANDLMDRRDVKIEQIAGLVDVTRQEDPGGAIRVLVDGSTLVSATRVHPLETRQDQNGDVVLAIRGMTEPLDVSGGELGGLLSLVHSSVPDLQASLDRMARNLISEVNRVHATGIPAGGPYSSLRSTHALSDVDGDGMMRDELLSNAGLPFDITSGNLHVNVTEEATGAVVKHSIPVVMTHTTVGDVLDALSAIPHLSAEVDARGHMDIVADTGYGFDFSSRLDPNPDAVGSFGGGQASLGAAASGPYALADGDTLSLDVGGTAVGITFSASSFANIAQATSDEIAAAINADAGAQANGLRAESVDGRVVLQTVGTGSSASFDLVGGSSLTALGWGGLAGSTITGHDNVVEVEISGKYTGSANDTFTFVAGSDGTIGTTPGLTVDVMNSAGQFVATLDVGPGYVPGTPIEVADGVSVSFGLGELSATHNDLLALDTVAESDTTGLLVAAGFGAFFTGTGAADIALDQKIALDPMRIASSGTGFDGDTGALLDLLDVQDLAVADLGGTSIGDFYADMIGDFGLEAAATIDSLDASDSLMASLELRRDQVSGVNVDEELVQLIEFEQAFEAASRYINVLNEINDDLLNLL